MLGVAHGDGDAVECVAMNDAPIIAPDATPSPRATGAKPMPAATLHALKGSIAKWEAIVAGTGNDERAHNCALCQAFEDCDGCPVAQRTGHPECIGTPYEDWSGHHIDVHNRYNAPLHPRKGCAECERLAQAELDFLKSLLPSDAP